MSTTDHPLTEAADLAREVLETAHEDDTITVCSVPDNKAAALARAVQSLAAEVDAYREENTRLREQVACVRALADEFDREASEHMNRPVYSRSGTRIRAALNGETHA